jgi:hypothetical protein
MPQPGYEGFAALGDLIMGGPQARAQLQYPKYYDQAMQAKNTEARHDILLEQGAVARAKRIAAEAMPEKARAYLLSVGQSPQAADLSTAVFGMANGQPNLGTFTKGLGDIADMELDRQIREKLEAGDVPGAQRLSAVKTDKVLPTLEAGGKAVFTPITGEAAMTALGDAAVDADRARGRSFDALTDQRHNHEPAPEGGKYGFQVRTIEADLGRKLTPRELQDLAAGKLDITIPAAAEAPAAAVPPTPAAAAEPAPLGNIAAEGYESFDAIPPEARGRLREGHKTTFGNGQVWTLITGKPVRVK